MYCVPPNRFMPHPTPVAHCSIFRSLRPLGKQRGDDLDEQSRSSTTFRRDHRHHDAEQHPHEERRRHHFARGDNRHDSSDSVTPADEENRRRRQCGGASVGTGADGTPAFGGGPRGEGIRRSSGGSYIGTSAASDRGGVQRLRRQHAHHRGRHREGQEEDGIERDADEEEEQPFMGMEESQVVTYGAQYNPVTGWL